MSAICSYSLSEIEKVFAGKVKYKENGVWIKMENPGHIKEVRIFLRRTHVIQLRRLSFLL
jgi:hypothetical protein